MIIFRLLLISMLALADSAPSTLKVQEKDLSDIRISVLADDGFDGSIHSELLNVSSGRYISASFLIDYEGDSVMTVRKMTASGIEIGTMPLGRPITAGDTLEFRISFGVRDEKCSVSLEGESCTFSALSDPFRNSTLEAMRGFDGGHLISFTIPPLPRSTSYRLEWILIISVIAADLILFAVLAGRGIRRRKDAGSSLDLPPKLISTESAGNSSIILFGNFKVVASSGEDITSRFSPIIRDLLLLLVCNTPKGGITSERLEGILWYDKPGKSAANNRGVSTTKLRTLLKEVGDCRIFSRNGYWMVETSDIYVDYFAFAKLLREGVLGKEQIDSLLTIVNRGMFLNDSSSLWSDELKSEVSDLVITVLTRYAGRLDIEKSAETVILLCDAVSKFDSLDETALELKCKAYRAKGNLKLAHLIFNNFVREYSELYGQPYSKNYTDVVS